MSFYSNPESIYAALWALVSGNPAFAYSSRRWRIWTAMAADQQPCIFQVQVPNRTIAYDYGGQRAQPSVKYYAEWVIYCRTEETLEGVPSTNINNLVGAATAVLEPVNFGMQGPVRKPLVDSSGNEIAYTVRVTEINIVEGVGADAAQSLAYIPLEITRPV
jgi:hypothetical protein